MTVAGILDGVEPVVRYYLQTKFALEQSLPFEADWLHLLVGPAIYLAAAVCLRKPDGGLLPWLAVVVLAVMNEMVDLAGARLNRPPTELLSYFESVTDIFLTISIPALLLLLSIFRPGRDRSPGLARRIRR